MPPFAIHPQTDELYNVAAKLRNAGTSPRGLQDQHQIVTTDPFFTYPKNINLFFARLNDTWRVGVGPLEKLLYNTKFNFREAPELPVDTTDITDESRYLYLTTVYRMRESIEEDAAKTKADPAIYTNYVTYGEHLTAQAMRMLARGDMSIPYADAFMLDRIKRRGVATHLDYLLYNSDLEKKEQQRASIGGSAWAEQQRRMLEKLPGLRQQALLDAWLPALLSESEYGTAKDLNPVLLTDLYRDIYLRGPEMLYRKRTAEKLRRFII